MFAQTRGKRVSLEVYRTDERLNRNVSTDNHDNSELCSGSEFVMRYYNMRYTPICDGFALMCVMSDVRFAFAFDAAVLVSVQK